MVTTAHQHVPFVANQVVVCDLGEVEAHPGVREPTHVVVVDASVLRGLVERLESGPGGGEGGREEGREGEREEGGMRKREEEGRGGG